MEVEWYKRPIVIIGFFVGLSILTGLATYGLFVSQKKSVVTGQSTNDNITVEKDKTTGESVATNTGKDPEVAGINPASPILLGFTSLLDQGITSANLYTFQDGVKQYFVSTTDYPPQSKVALSNASCALPDSSGYVSCTYLLTVNDSTKLNGTLKTNLSGPVEVTIAKDGKQVYSVTQQPSN